MLKLLKYEFRKQMVLITILISLLIALELIFFFGMMISNKDIITVSYGLQKVCFTITFIYLLFEPAFKYEKDLGYKQGYLLFMIPRSTIQIVSAKIAAGMIQTALFFTFLVGVSQLNDSLYSFKYKVQLHSIDQVFNMYGNVGFSISEYFLTLLVLLTLCFFITTLAFLSISMSYSYMAKGILNSFTSLTLFILIFFIEILVVGVIMMGTLNETITNDSMPVIISGLIFAIPALFNFWGTITVLENNISL